MILKSVIHFPDTNAVEATWVEILEPARNVPETKAPDRAEIVNGEAVIVPGEIIPAHTIPAVEQQVRCHTYADVQMDMLEADLGADAAQYADLIAAVRANIKPPAPVVPSIPASVTMRQARLALLQSGMLAQVNAAIASMPGETGDKARIEWEFSSAVERHRPFVASIAGALGLSESQLDDLFILAASL